MSTLPPLEERELELARPVTASAPTESCIENGVAVKQADGFVLVTRSRDLRKVIPPYKYFYSYDHYDHLNDALDMYSDFERGEFSGREPVGIYPVRFGLPFGPEISPQALAIAEYAR